ncbi:MAG: redoxin domain-containing protein [Nitrospiraceae bacterium]|nr:redoxin domain-containing protein [Nitrospiraceae bacterium]
MAPDRRKDCAAAFPGRSYLALFFISVFVAGILMTAPSAATLQNLQTGMKGPDFSIKGLDDQTKGFADLKGQKLTVLLFWSTWSLNSGKALERMEGLYSKFKGKGLSVVAINVDAQEITDDTLAKIRSEISGLKIDYPVLIDYGLPTFHDYGIIAVPTTVILDKDRVIKYELSGFPVIGSDDMESYITDTFEPGAARVAKVKKGYEPEPEAVRCYNLGMRMLQSPRSAMMAPAWFKKAIEADPKFALPYISLGDIYAGQDNPGLAGEQYKDALDKQPGNVIAMCKLGKILLAQGKTADSKALLEKAMKVEDSYPPCYYYLGYIYGSEGDLSKAGKMFDAAVKVNPMDPKIYIYEGKVYEKQGRIKEAAAAYGSALKIILKQ